MIADFDIPELQLETKDDEKELSIYRVPTEKVHDVWPLVEKVLKSRPELWERYHTEQSFHDMVLDGTIMLWFVIQSENVVMMFASNIVTYPTGRALSVFWGVGKGMSEWLPLVLSSLQNFAARGGINWVNIDGRLPWKAPLAKYGYELTSARFTKTIHSKDTVN